MRFSSVEKDTLGRGSFARVDVGNNTDISIPFDWVLASHQNSCNPTNEPE
jgi:hypothetical protein